MLDCWHFAVPVWFCLEHWVGMDATLLDKCPNTWRLLVLPNIATYGYAFTFTQWISQVRYHMKMLIMASSYVVCVYFIFVDIEYETPRGQFEDKRSRNCPYLDTINR